MLLPNGTGDRWVPCTGAASRQVMRPGPLDGYCPRWTAGPGLGTPGRQVLLTGTAPGRVTRPGLGLEQARELPVDGAVTAG